MDENYTIQRLVGLLLTDAAKLVKLADWYTMVKSEAYVKRDELESDMAEQATDLARNIADILDMRE